MLHARIAEVPIVRISNGKIEHRNDLLAIEEPLEIRVTHGAENGTATDAIGITMRTPGCDAELAAGFLFCEGVVASANDIAHIEEGPPQGRDKPFPASVDVRLKPGVSFDTERLSRHVLTTSSCGLCGSLDLDHLPFPEPENRISVELEAGIIAELPDRLHRAQTLFRHTGGLHAAALFSATGELITLREDIGRHNAMDKLIGYGLSSGALPFSDCIVLFSGRVSFDLMQKAIAAGLQVVASVGPPSNLAVELAERYGVTLIGFLRGHRFNIYSHDHRVRSEYPG